jgi:Domain of unknown function (DUF5615)
LIDECLSPDLVKVAIKAGFLESSHVVWQGKSGWKDWELKPFILDGDWTFVTKNSIDFRGPANRPGTNGQYADVRLPATNSAQGACNDEKRVFSELVLRALTAVLFPNARLKRAEPL